MARGEVTGTERVSVTFVPSWTYEELGLAGWDEAAVKEAVSRELDISLVVDCLLVDCPAELYWFDKTGRYKDRLWSVRIRKYGIGHPYMISMPVAEGYRADPSDLYSVSTAKTGAAQTALTKAQEIVSQNKDKTTYEKLLAYKDAICDLTSYNHEAADTEGTPLRRSLAADLCL